MKILIITDGIYPFVIGGMQKHSYYLAKNLAEAGHQITLIHCIASTKNIPSKEDLRAEFGADAMKNLKIIGLKFPAPSWYPGHYLKESYAYSKSVFATVRNQLNEFDFIYAKGFTAWSFLEKKKGGMKMPPIGIKFHGYEMFQTPANFKSRLHNYLLKGPTLWNNKNADFIFSYGGKITDIIQRIGVGGEKILEIPTGIEQSWCLEKPASLAEKKIRFAFVGRFERRKGVEELSAALKILTPDFDFQFEFIGPIPPSAKISSNKIRYHGSKSDKKEIQNILDTCQVLVVPSHSEGMPNVIMEGMARGLAILATDVGAVRSVVNEENGWFVEPGDTKALTQLLQMIIQSDPKEIQARQKSSCTRIHSFHWSKIAEITASKISKCLR